MLMNVLSNFIQDGKQGALRSPAEILGHARVIKHKPGDVERPRPGVGLWLMCTEPVVAPLP